MLFHSSSWKIIFAAVILMPLAFGCNTFQTSYFGVEDEAIFSPDSFGETEKTIEKAKKDVDSIYARNKIDAAMKLGKRASHAYWEGFEEESDVLLALARQAALHAELYHDQPPPQYVSRTDAVVEPPHPPDRLFPDRPPVIDTPNNPMVLHRVLFGSGASGLQPEATSRLDDLLPLLTSRKEIFVEIAGFASPDESNPDRLSQTRARAVFNHLAAGGIDRKRMVINSRGQAEAGECIDAGAAETCSKVEIHLLAEKPETLQPGGPQERYTIQVAAFKKRENADRKRDELLSKNYPAYSIKAEVAGKIWYRARIGPYEDRETAEKIFEKLKSEGYEAILLRLKDGAE